MSDKKNKRFKKKLNIEKKRQKGDLIFTSERSERNSYYVWALGQSYIGRLVDIDKDLEPLKKIGKNLNKVLCPFLD